MNNVNNENIKINNFNEIYGYKTLNVTSIEENELTKIIENGKNGIQNYYKSENINGTIFTGYINELEPFVVCTTTRGNRFLVTEKFSIMLDGEKVVIDNKNENYYSSNSIKFEYKNKADDSNEVDYFYINEKTNEAPTTRLKNNIVAALTFKYLSTTYNTLNDNATNRTLSKARDMFTGDKVFFIETNSGFRKGTDKRCHYTLYFAYSNEENYKNGEKPLAIVGEVSMRTPNHRTTNDNRKFKLAVAVNLILDDMNEYQAFSSKYSYDIQPYIRNYSEYKSLMEEMGYSEVPISDFFKQITTKGLQEPNIVNAINHIMNLQKLCIQDNVSIDSYSVNINGVAVSIDNNKKKMEHQL